MIAPNATAGPPESPPPDAGNGGWFRVGNGAIGALARAGGSAALVFLVLARHANGDGEAWPGVEWIAPQTQLRPRAVRYALGRLKAVGLVGIDQRPGQSNRYRLTPARTCR